MDIVLILSFAFGVVYLGMEQMRASAERRMVGTLGTRGRSTVTATKWGVVLSVHPSR